MYNIDFDKLIAFNMPGIIRKSRHFTWLTLLVSQIKKIYDEFIVWKATILYNTAHSGQVISLEHILNDVFDRIYRRIYIGEGTRASQNYIFNKIEDQEETYLFNTSETADPQLYLFNDQEDVASSFDFTVMVPASMIFSQNRMKALINIYIAGKTYKILTY